MPYGDLTEAEKATWNEYTNLRQISDWSGFSEGQAQRKDDSRAWLVERRKEIWRSAQAKAKGGDGKGWKHADRRARYDFLKDGNLNTGAPKHEVRLPCPGSCTTTEAVFIEEREVYLVFATTTPEQKKRKLANVNWLVDRRQQIYRLMQDEPKVMKAERQARYDALCIATGHGKVYDQWKKTHNKWGVPKAASGGSSTGDHSRDAIVDWCTSYLGVNERPPGSNRGEPQPSGWQRKVYGSAGVAWCACFTVCSAWEAGGLKGSGTASVQLNVNLARSGQGIYRGWTTDPSRVRPGDHAAIGGTSTHTAVVVGPTAYDTIEGNTSPGSEGSQYNGGCVAKRQRKGAIVGWMLS